MAKGKGMCYVDRRIQHVKQTGYKPDMTQRQDKGKLNAHLQQQLVAAIKKLEQKKAQNDAAGIAKMEEIIANIKHTQESM